MRWYVIEFIQLKSIKSERILMKSYDEFLMKIYQLWNFEKKIFELGGEIFFSSLLKFSSWKLRVKYRMQGNFRTSPKISKLFLTEYRKEIYLNVLHTVQKRILFFFIHSVSSFYLSSEVWNSKCSRRKIKECLVIFDTSSRADNMRISLKSCAGW